MDRKLSRVMSSILEGRKKAVDAHKEYKDLLMNKPDIISFNYNSSVNKKYDEFRVKLYNYINAVKNKRPYFEKYILIEEKLNHIPKGANGKNVYLLLKAFRHKNEHPENIEYEEDYVLCIENITLEILEELLYLTNDVLENEFKNYEEDSILQIVLSNPDLVFGAKKFYNKMLEISKIKDEKYPEIYDYNQELMAKLSDFDFKNLNFDSLESILEIIKPYIENPNVKKMLQNLMSERSFSQFEKIINFAEDMNLDDYIREVEKFANYMREDKIVGI